MLPGLAHGEIGASRATLQKTFFFWLFFDKHARAEDGAVRFDDQMIHSTLVDCWTRPTGLAMFNDETCHLTWRYMVGHTRVSTVESVEPLSSESAADFRPEQTGAVHVHFAGGFQAMWRSCSFPRANHTFLNDLIAYHVDRLLHVKRVPPVVVRSLDYRELSSSLQNEGETFKRLQQMNMHCHRSKNLMAGVMVGWTRYPLQPITTDVLSAWFANEAFDARKPTQRLLEFSKLAVELIMFDLPHRITHGPVLEMFVPHGDNKFTGNYFYVQVENERANWDTPYEQVTLATPLCDRTTRSPTFRCAVTWPDATPAPTRSGRARVRGILTSFLASACLFPKTVAMRLLHFGSLNSSVVESMTHEVHQSIKEELGADAADLPPPSMRALDGRVRHVFQALVQCVKRFGTANVIMAEEFDSVFDDPPSVHFDPAGHRYVLNKLTGRWVRNDTTPVIDLNRDSLFQLARDELVSTHKLGLLRPTEQELLQLASLKLPAVGQRANSSVVLQFSDVHTAAPITAGGLDDYQALFGGL